MRWSLCLLKTLKCPRGAVELTRLAHPNRHVYAVAEMAFKHMTIHNQSQSLVVSGESGAGKTEVRQQIAQ